MTNQGAFFGDGAVKIAALEKVNSSEFKRLFGRDATPEERLLAADALGVDRSFFVLALSLLGSAPGEKAKKDVGSVLGKIEPGFDVAKLVKAWVEWLWQGPIGQVKSRLRDTKVFESAAEIIAAVQGERGSLTPQEWRKLRRALYANKDDRGEAADYALVVAALAWDLTQSPAAITDVLIAWENAVIQAFDRSIGWTPEMTELVMRQQMDMHAAITKEIGSPDDVEREAYMDRYKLLAEKMLQESPNADLFQKAMSRGQALNVAVERWRENVRAAFIELVEVKLADGSMA